MLVIGITIAIIFILLAFYAFRLISKVIYTMFLVRFFGNMIQPKGAKIDDNDFA